MGVREENLAEAVSVKIPADVFYPKPFLSDNTPLVIGIYGKAGPGKGSSELLEAMSVLINNCFPCVLRACWGGRYMPDINRQIGKLGITGRVLISKFISHWKIPAFIWGCHAVMFLENNFSIKFHGPGIPLESLCCGRPIVTTEEIERKQASLLMSGENCIVIPGPILKVENVVQAIKELHSKIVTGWPNVEWPHSGYIMFKARQQMENLLKSIQEKI